MNTMRMKLKKTVLIAAGAAILSPVFAHAAARPTPTPDLPPLNLDKCGTVAADKTLVPAKTYDEVVSASANGLYYFTRPECRRYVVDVVLKPYDPLPFRTVYGRGHKLPGAGTACSGSKPSWYSMQCVLEDGNVPGDERDCQSYEKRISFYTKPKGAKKMSFAGSATTKGSWNGDACVFTHSDWSSPYWGMGVEGGFEGTLRVAVAVQMRGVPQRAAVGLKTVDKYRP